MNARNCPKCGGRMSPGFMLDRGDHNASGIAAWNEGEPQRGFLGVLKIRGRKRLLTTTFRCERCAYLESYAFDT